MNQIETIELYLRDYVMLRRSVLICIVFNLALSASAQTPSEQVDEKKLNEVLGRSGLTEEQKKLLKEKIEKGELKPPEGEPIPAEEVQGRVEERQEQPEEPEKKLLKRVEEEELEEEPDGMEPEVLYFGYHIFGTVPAAFEPDPYGPIDPSYPIGPGDEILLSVWGDTEFRHTLTVDREGYIFIPTVGQVLVNGLTLRMLEQRLHKLFSKFYSGLVPTDGRATTFMDVSLGKLRPIKIFVVGEVARPGGYAINSYSTVFNSLYSVGGPTVQGTLREIRVIRRNQIVSVIDLYHYLLKGDKSKDIRLQNDDTIFIPPRGKTVTIKGEVRRPAIYELKEGERLKDLIEFSGGLRATAYIERIQVDRIVPFEQRKEETEDRMILDVDLAKFLRSKEDFHLSDGDVISVFSIFDIRRNIVVVQGAVGRPGPYELEEGATVRDVIKKADGVLGGAYMERTDVIRTKKDGSLELLTPHLGRALEGDERENLRLDKLDRMVVYSIQEMIGPKSVHIRGQVKKPGSYPLMEHMTLYDLVFQAGGFLDKEFRDVTYLKRADLLRLNEEGVTKRIIPFHLGKLLKGAEEENLLLKNQDEVVVYPLSAVKLYDQYVHIIGEVKKPGQYVLKSNMTLQDLILEAGGLTEAAYMYQAEVARVDPRKVVADSLATILYVDIDRDFRVSPKRYAALGSQSDVETEPEGFRLVEYDNVFIRVHPDYQFQRNVTIQGEVRFPGTYTLTRKGERISDLVTRAGGLKEEAFLLGGRLMRGGKRVGLDFQKAITDQNPEHNVALMASDTLMVPPVPRMVQVEGEVYTPGLLKFVPGAFAGEYIAQAGGLTERGDQDRILLIEPTGEVTLTRLDDRDFFSPRVRDGSIIQVAVKQEEPKGEPFDWTEFMKEVASISASFATIIFVVTR